MEDEQAEQVIPVMDTVAMRIVPPCSAVRELARVCFGEIAWFVGCTVIDLSSTSSLSKPESSMISPI